MANIFGQRGGTVKGADKKMHPAPVEVLALGVACAVRLTLCKQGITQAINFREVVTEEVKRAGATHQKWSNRIILEDVYYKMFYKMLDSTITKYLKYMFNPAKGLSGEARKEKMESISFDFVRVCIFLLIASIPGLCTTWEEFEQAAEKAKLDAILQSKVLGGKEHWQLSDFINERRWDSFGELSGIGKRVWYVLRDIACVGNDVPKEDWEKYRYGGDRSKLLLLRAGESGPILDDDVAIADAAAAAEQADAEDEEEEGFVSPPPHKKPKGGGEKRGMGDADKDSLGLQQSYYAKLQLVQTRYPGTPFEKVKGLLGSKTGVVGEQGGKMLGAYLFSVKQSSALCSELFDETETVSEFLTAQEEVCCC